MDDGVCSNYRCMSNAMIECLLLSLMSLAIFAECMLAKWVTRRKIDPVK